MRLIDADKIDTRPRGNNSQRTMWANIKAVIDNAPTVEPICPYLSDDEVKQPCIQGPCEVDALKRPQGKWKRIIDEYYDVECPFCGFKEDGIMYNFCPQCGAKMQTSD